jgi:hypothetical protein
MSAMRSRACLTISSRRRGMTLGFRCLSLRLVLDNPTCQASLYPADRATRRTAPHQSVHRAYGTGRSACQARPLGTEPCLRCDRPRRGLAGWDRRRFTPLALVLAICIVRPIQFLHGPLGPGPHVVVAKAVIAQALGMAARDIILIELLVAIPLCSSSSTTSRRVVTYRFSLSSRPACWSVGPGG